MCNVLIVLGTNIPFQLFLMEILNFSGPLQTIGKINYKYLCFHFWKAD
jgi:hypothetical protein